jgi:hypothetical protein
MRECMSGTLWCRVLLVYVMSGCYLHACGFSVVCLVHLGCPGASYCWFPRVIRPSSWCAFSQYPIVSHYSVLCMGRSLACCI